MKKKSNCQSPYKDAHDCEGLQSSAMISCISACLSSDAGPHVAGMQASCSLRCRRCREQSILASGHCLLDITQISYHFQYPSIIPIHSLGSSALCLTLSTFKLYIYFLLLWKIKHKSSQLMDWWSMVSVELLWGWQSNVQPPNHPIPLV